MTWSRLRPGLVWLSRLLVAGVFIAAAVPKLADPVAFAEDIRNYDAFPEFSVHVLAAMVPILELLAAGALFIPRIRRGATLILMGLDLAFIVLIGSVLVRGIDIRCGCFGGASEEAETISWTTLARDVALLVPIWLGMLHTAPPAEGTSSAEGPSRPA